MQGMRKWWLAVVCAVLLSGCGYNDIQIKDEAANSAWSEVLNQYKRRADLIPGLVNTVQGYADHEKEVLTRVTEARAKVGSVQLTADQLGDERAMRAFTAAQGELGQALSRLMVVTENYPELKADGAFRDLQAQLEGTENRIAVARGRYVKAVEDYNVTVRTFPTRLTAMMTGHGPKANFGVEDEATLSQPPTVQFNNAPAPAR